ncbi:MAG TPA: hypothetical protein VFA33_05205 [Bryobacteraceae bacterium]|nr:hypothetical protein [Bryobacteraceae bacterium]
MLDDSARMASPNRQRVRQMHPASRLQRGIAAFHKACRKRMPAVMENVLFFGGLASVVYGCWTVWHPLGPLVGGGLAVWVSMLTSLERESK